MKASVRIVAAAAALVLGATLATSTASQAQRGQAQGNTGDRAVAKCTGRQLDVELGRLGAAAGSRYQVIRFTNMGLRPCVLRGHPKVSHRGKHHKRIGKPAKWVGGSGARVVLRPGGMAKTVLRIPSWANFPAKDCHAKGAPRLRVVPPGTHRTVGFRYPVKVCTTKKGRDSVRPVRLARR